MPKQIGFNETEEEGIALLEGLISKLPRERRVFTTQALCFLMVGHYLVSRWSLSAGLRVLLDTGASKLLGKCRRVEQGEHSRSTSGLSQARSALEIESLYVVWNELLSQLKGKQLLWKGRAVKTIDGTSTLLQPLSGLRRAYPPTKNQFGESAYPVLQMTVVHDTLSGLAEDCEIGPLNGEEREGELEQSRILMSRFEPGAIVVADRGHGILQMVRHAQSHQLDVVYRLNETMAQSILVRNGKKLAPELNCRVDWTPSKRELKNHKDWQADQGIRGRIITKRVVQKNGKEMLLALFTTLDQNHSSAEILELYAHRWEIENEIRDLKKTIKLSEIAARTPKMIKKEIIAAIIAYNIVRAVILQAAKVHGIADPKRLSFKNAFIIVQDITWRLHHSKSQREREKIISSALEWIAVRVNVKRPGRSFRRAVYKKPIISIQTTKRRWSLGMKN